ncbi:MAG TPA: hypothetical protein PLD73_11260 [Candidatus Hydrogenedentes bacterium]|jgi:enoyl-CoA hydratase/carnithine racemase|nr:hypothetical protein [Candidatus Hydrogenedentota bacterium]
MGYEERKALYEKVEALRGRRLIAYVTSSRPNASASISSDAICEFIRHLEAIGNTGEIDIIIVSNGGDPNAALRIVSLIKEKTGGFFVLIPYSAFSAATLIALGAKKIYMHPYGNLGPTDPQITNQQKNVQFSTEDLPALLKFARDDVRLTDQANLLEVFKLFCHEAGPMALGFAGRQSLLWNRVAEKLLASHMENKEKVSSIADSFSREYLHHGYSISPSEARDMGLPIEDNDPELDSLLWSIWLDLAEEMRNDEPFSPMEILWNDPNCAALFEPVPYLQMPAGVMPQLVQPVVEKWIQTHGIAEVPPSAFQMVAAIMENSLMSTHHVVEGQVFARRNPDLKIEVNCIQHKAKWQQRKQGQSK